MNYLTETKLQEIMDDAMKYQNKPDVIVLPTSLLKSIEKNNPKLYKDLIKRHQQAYKCNWQRMGEEIGANESGEK